MASKYHECETINKSENASIEKINGNWTWVFWNDKKGNQGHGIRYCPYCVKDLTEESQTSIGGEMVRRMIAKQQEVQS